MNATISSEGRQSMTLAGTVIALAWFAASTSALEGRSRALDRLVSQDAIESAVSGTGQTIGIIARLILVNKTESAFVVKVPPMLLVSVSGRHQNHAVPAGQSVALGPNGRAELSLSGVCLNARKSPASGTGDLLALDADGRALTTAGSPEAARATSKFPAASARALLRNTGAIMKTAAELQARGRWSTPLAADPAKERDTVVQWTTWLSVSRSEGDPVTKSELAAKVREQAGGNAVAAGARAELEKGVDDLWSAVELTGRKAKVL